MEYSTGEAVVVMDVDMQDPPELVSDMIAKWREGYDVVLPQRTRRTGEPWVKTAGRRDRIQGDQQNRRRADTSQHG